MGIALVGVVGVRVGPDQCSVQRCENGPGDEPEDDGQTFEDE